MVKAAYYLRMTVPTDTTPLPGYDFIRFVLENLVEDKDELKIEQKLDDMGVLITVSVSSRDMGKLIGRSGQTIKALKTLLRTLGGKNNQRINLKLMEPTAS